MIRESVAFTDWMLRCIEQRVCSLARIPLQGVLLARYDKVVTPFGLSPSKPVHHSTGRRGLNHPSVWSLVSVETKELLATPVFEAGRPLVSVAVNLIYRTTTPVRR